MKLINRKNFIPVLCITYTIISLSIMLTEGIIYGKLTHSQTNMVQCFILSLVAIFILSLQYRFDRFPLLLVIILQYFAAIAVVYFLVFLSSFIEPVSKGGCHDIFVSFSIPYLIGAIVYYICLHCEIKKQNRMIQALKQKKEK